MTFAMQSNPHIINKRTTRSIMLELSGVIGVVALASIIYNFVARGSYYGLSALLIIFLAVSLRFATLYTLYQSFAIRKRKTSKLNLRTGELRSLIPTAMFQV